MSMNMEVGEMIAWEPRDGNTMTATITFLGFDTYYANRIDGGQVRVLKSKCRTASHEDVEAAARFFKEIGS